MRTTAEVLQALAATVAADVAALPDAEVRAEALDLLRALNLAHVALMARLASFDRRDLARPDGVRSTKAWLSAFGRLSPHLASATMTRAHTLDRLPALATAAAGGDISAEHLSRVADLTDKVGEAVVASVESILADAATTLNPTDFGQVGERVRAHADPDGPEPDPDDILNRHEPTHRSRPRHPTRRQTLRNPTQPTLDHTHHPKTGRLRRSYEMEAVKVYKLLSTQEWRDAQAAGEFRGSEIDLADGYVHFSTAEQVVETAARHFAGQRGLSMLTVDADQLGDALRWEPSRGGDLFPHLYGPLLVSAVLAEVDLDEAVPVDHAVAQALR